MSDSVLVSRARGGDQQAWAELVHRHHVAAYRTAFAALLREDEADEAAQEAWVTAWQRLDQFRSDASFKTWLIAIAWRKALDRRRRVVRWLRLAAHSGREADDQRDIDALPDDQANDAESILLDRESRRLVRRAMTGLPRRQRDCLMLAAGGELSYDEIGQMLGVPVGTVKWRVSEARKRLRARIDGLHATTVSRTLP